jgi:hypothetical protein
LIVFQKLEVVVERSDLKHLDHGQTHLGRQRHHVALEQAFEVIIQHMQVLDQQVTAVACFRHRTNEGLHLGAGFACGLSAFELGSGLAQLLANLVQANVGSVRHVVQ